MEKIKNVSWLELIRMSNQLAEKIEWKNYENFYGVPKNGMILAPLVYTGDRELIHDENLITKKTLILDDLVDSGRTLARFPENDHAVLFRKPHSPQVQYFVEEVSGWIQFPFEKDGTEQEIENHVTRILEAIGENPNREGLIGTPGRVARMYKEIFSGYGKDEKEIFKAKFKDDCDTMVVVKDIPFYSMCEHHMIPFSGLAHVAYVPNGEVLGLSKFARLVDVYAKRLQIQEKMTREILDSIIVNLRPLGAMVVLEAEHLCMAMRGVQKQGSRTVTSAVFGELKEKPAAREEALKLFFK